MEASVGRRETQSSAPGSSLPSLKRRSGLSVRAAITLAGS